MYKYSLAVHQFPAQRRTFASTPVPADSYENPAVDDAYNPTRVTVHTTTGTAAALRIAQRHLTLVTR
ncbi:hypothetical protein ACN6LA_001220 [Streptomyces sp. SAS_269]|uniref:hypothetical protein n=1 Tax=Streptomyces sp. SAS_269 TaxID=3412749 RepID=UPI00403D0EE1